MAARPTVGDSRGWSDSASCLAISISSQHTRLGMRRTGGRARFMPACRLGEAKSGHHHAKFKIQTEKGEPKLTLLR